MEHIDPIRPCKIVIEIDFGGIDAPRVFSLADILQAKVCHFHLFICLWGFFATREELNIFSGRIQPSFVVSYKIINSILLF